MRNFVKYILISASFWMLMPDVIASAGVSHVVKQGMIRDYRVKPEEGATDYIWEAYSDPAFRIKSSSGQVDLKPTMSGNKNEISVHWRTGGYFYLMVTIIGETGCINKKVWPFFVEDRWLPYAIDDTVYTAIDIPVWIDVLANDSSSMVPSTMQIISDPGSGYVNINMSDYGVDYYPDFDFMGVDSFLYVVCDYQNYCDTARVLINVEDVVTAPQVFTPNGDGYNDLFEIIGLERYPENHFVVFNRWGNKVFETYNYRNDWDGHSNTKYTVGDRQLPVGVYYYVLKYANNRIKQGGLYLEK
jgi:gliding motility-associated-like protein